MSVSKSPRFEVTRMRSRGWSRAAKFTSSYHQPVTSELNKRHDGAYLNRTAPPLKPPKPGSAGGKSNRSDRPSRKVNE